LAETLTDFEASHGSLLSDFSGDTSPFVMLKPQLEDLLESRFSVPKGRVSPLTWAVTALLILLPMAWGVHAFLRHRELDSLLSLLREQDGIVVSEVTREGGVYQIAGLRDPGAADPDSLRGVAGMEEGEVSFFFQPFHALAPGLILARARDVLQPPDGISLHLEAGILKVTGTAPLAWIRTMRERSPSLMGVDAVDESGLSSPGWDRLLEIVRDLERVELLAPLGSAELAPGQGADVDRIAGWIRELQGLQGELGVVAQVVITGFADPSGTEEYNIQLSRARADRVQSLLVARGVSPGSLVAVGGGVSYLDPAGQGTQRDRRITFRVVQAL
jgi:OOP family OmpA-OmpF porin